MWISKFKTLLSFCVVFWGYHVLLSGETVQYEEYRSIVDIAAFGNAEAHHIPSAWKLTDENGISVAPASQDIQHDTDADASARKALCMTAPTCSVTLLSPPYPLREDCRAVTGAATGAGTKNAEVRLTWLCGTQPLRTEVFHSVSMNGGNRHRYNLSETERPDEADFLQVTILMPADADGMYCWETIRITGTFVAEPTCSILGNCIGYELFEPKMFTVRSNFAAQTASFLVLDAANTIVCESPLTPCEIIMGAEGSPWDGYYYQGDFSELNTEGTYVIEVALDECRAIQTSMQIGHNLLWEKAFAPVLAAFQSNRINTDSDDEGPIFWQTDGDSIARNARLLWTLTYSWSILRGTMGTHPAFTPLDNEVHFGMERLKDWAARHGISSAENDCFYASSLACFARCLPEDAMALQCAQSVMEKYMENKMGGTCNFSVAMDLYASSQDDRYLEYARQIFPGITLERPESLLAYEGITGEMITISLVNAYINQTQLILDRAKNSFGLTQTDGEGRQGYFIWGDGAPNPSQGNSARILKAANQVAQAYRYTVNPEYKKYIYAQLNWILGNNPFNVCLVSGLCSSEQDASQTDDIDETAPRGAVLYGIGPDSVGRDAPHLQLLPSKDAYSLENNGLYVSVMAHLKRIPALSPK